MTRPRQTVSIIPIRQLTAHPANIREDLGDLDDMAKSIREHGVVQPLTVTEHPTREQVFVVIDGHRRLAGALKAHETKVPVIIRHNLTDQAEHTILMLVTGVHRRELNPVERARGYGRLQAAGLNMSEIARRVGLKPSTISYYLNLLRLDEGTLERVETGEINVGDAVTAVREQRQSERVDNGTPLRGRPKWDKFGGWFGDGHRLRAAVARRCKHRDRRQVGGKGCGPCWEQTIAEEYALDPAAAAAAAAAAAEVDPVLVQRILDGDWAVAHKANKAERHVIADAWAARGGSEKQLCELTGWRPGRYPTSPEPAEGNEQVAS